MFSRFFQLQLMVNGESGDLGLVLIDINNLRHGGRTHTRVSEEEPIQSMPPSVGAGLSHSLVRISIPVPHVTEHNIKSKLPPNL
jgi:hypothetical protein